MAYKNNKKKFDIYEMINDKIISQLEKGVIPWKKSWKVQNSFPRNLISGKIYQGVNVMLLSIEILDKGYKSPYWLTYNQAQSLGGNVIKGQKSSQVVFWNIFEKKVENKNTGKDEIKKIPFLKYFNVFNVEQCEDIPAEKIPAQKVKDNDNNSILNNCEDIIKNFKNCPKIQHENKSKAYYSPTFDIVNMPLLKQFDSSEEYYCTTFHELVHSTGHKLRLNRDGITNYNSFGSHEYSKEELVAEMGASYLSSEAGISERVIKNSASYINSWLTQLRNEKKWLVCAFGKAQKAVNHILQK